ncbi:MerR family transcriptional regulator [Novosphingobium sp. PC22D]|uniref:MerR family transcriptional regulator n=1 Tax=Novosphingobium sp. PC22D TaxID=1962403 RepID=UPI000BF03924|nr:MerR family transcriptional regulator [Novosphingobium sp. PC22D]PEQ14193.1 MerR family transcriptional regulator [Novosphingobium sp. PC22D]
MTDSLTIDEVARRTGLTPRALRFYEGRGLVAPLRTGSGRRLYSRDDLERLHRIVALKRAGFTLSDIARLLSGKSVAIAPILEVQLAALDARRRDLESAAAALRSALSRIEGGEPLDAATLCSLIRHGDTIMTHKQDWAALSEPYMTEQAKADFAAARPRIPDGFDEASYGKAWADLGAKVKAALPLDPASAEAKALLDAWNALLQPFAAVATPAMRESVTRMYDDIPNSTEGAPSPGFDHEVWQFVRAAGKARHSA